MPRQLVHSKPVLRNSRCRDLCTLPPRMAPGTFVKSFQKIFGGDIKTSERRRGSTVTAPAETYAQPTSYVAGPAASEGSPSLDQETASQMSEAPRRHRPSNERSLASEEKERRTPSPQRLKSRHAASLSSHYRDEDTASTLIDPRAKGAALRYSLARQEREQKREARKPADKKPTSPQKAAPSPVSTPQAQEQPRAERKRHQESQSLEFPEQEREIGPPPRRDRQNGRAPKGQHGQIYDTDLLSRLDELFDSETRPVYNQSPIRHSPQERWSRAESSEGSPVRSRAVLGSQPNIRDHLHRHPSLNEDKGTSRDPRQGGRSTGASVAPRKAYTVAGDSAPGGLWEEYNLEDPGQGWASQDLQTKEINDRLSHSHRPQRKNRHPVKMPQWQEPKVIDVGPDIQGTGGPGSLHVEALAGTSGRHPQSSRPDGPGQLRSRSGRPDRSAERTRSAERSQASRRNREPAPASPGDRLPTQAMPERLYSDLPAELSRQRHADWQDRGGGSRRDDYRSSKGPPYVGEYSRPYSAQYDHLQRRQRGHRPGLHSEHPSFSEGGLEWHVVTAKAPGQEKFVADETYRKVAGHAQPLYPSSRHSTRDTAPSDRDTNGVYPRHAAGQAAQRRHTQPSSLYNAESRAYGDGSDWRGQRESDEFEDWLTPAPRSGQNGRPAGHLFRSPSRERRLEETVGRSALRSAAQLRAPDHSGPAELHEGAHISLAGLTGADLDDASATSLSEHQSHHSRKHSRTLAAESEIASLTKELQELRAYKQSLIEQTGPGPSRGRPHSQDPSTSGRAASIRRDSKQRTDRSGSSEVKIPTPQITEDPVRRLSYTPPSPHVEAAVRAADKQIEALRSKLRIGAAPLDLASQGLPATPTEAESGPNDEELAELRRVVAFLQSKMAGLEHELHTTREQQAAAKAEAGSARQELAGVQEQLGAAESSKAQVVNLMDELHANLERAVGEKAAELGAAETALLTAQAEAAHQEELAEMAKGELDEYKRRMAAEVEHARSEALKLAGSGQRADARKLQEEVSRARAASLKAQQEQEDLRSLLEASKAQQQRLQEELAASQVEISAQQGAQAKDSHQVALLEQNCKEQAAALEKAEAAAAQLQAEHAALQNENAALKRGLGKGGIPKTVLASLKYDELVDESVLGSRDLDADEEGQNSSSRIVELEEMLGRANQATKEATEQRAELLAANSELQVQLRSCREDLHRLQDVETLADEALKALEAQTQEAIRLRSQVTELEEGLKRKETAFEEASTRLAVLEDAIADRDSQVLEKATLPEDLRKGISGSQGQSKPAGPRPLSGLSSAEAAALLGTRDPHHSSKGPKKVLPDAEARASKEQTAVKLAKTAYKRVAKAEAENLLLRGRLAGQDSSVASK